MSATNTPQQAVEDWAVIVLDRWRKNMTEMGINNASTHATAFTHFANTSAGGDISKIEFAFDYFLKFTDMGVGKGVKLGNTKTLTIRRPKPWYSKSFLYEVRRLSEIMAYQFSNYAAIKIVENLEDNSKK